MYVYNFQAYMIYKPSINWYGDDVTPPKPTPLRSPTPPPHSATAADRAIPRGAEVQRP